MAGLQALALTQQLVAQAYGPMADDASGGSARGTPFDVGRIIMSHSWLLGGLLAVLAATFESVGLIMQKKAQYQLMGARINELTATPSWRKMLRKKGWWCGLVLYLLYSPVNMLALAYAPETTVLPCNAFLIFFNAYLSFGVLYEKFRKSDIRYSLICTFGAVVMNSSMSKTMPGHLEDFPVEQVIDMSKGILFNPGFAAYVFTFLSLFVSAAYVIIQVPEGTLAKPIAVPLMVGLLRAAFHFMSKIMMTLVSRAHLGPEVWKDPLTMRVILVTSILFIINVYAMAAGNRQLPAKFFVPASYVAMQALIVTQDLLFFRSWELMSNTDIAIFVAGTLVTLLGVIGISPVSRVAASPDASGLNSPLLPEHRNVLKLHHDVLGIMDEYRIRKVSEPDPAPLKTIKLKPNIGNFWRLFPILISLIFMAIPTALWYSGNYFFAFVLLTAFSMYQSWKIGAHIALFCFLGTRKIAHYKNANFEDVYRAEMKQDGGWKHAGGPRWENVFHFVLIVNYKEDPEVLKLAIKSIAASGIAKKQICIVLAMEEREQESKAKAAELQSFFKNDFWHVEATFHPAGLPGETPGKSANTRWAAERVFDEMMKQYNVDENNAIITVADADSEFHSEYFAALSYYYIRAGGKSGETPDRFLTIWQPPILHFKNYVTQPAVVRCASFVTTEHELANLADPNATRVPYSTYSISAVLAKAVGGWDPDWISEDWHMSIKCFFATAGRLRISPIFLPILNYAPEDETWWKTIVARWVQGKRHALGFSELVFLLDHLPRVLVQVEGFREKVVFCWRAFFLWFKLLMIHVLLAVLFAFLPLNAILIAHFANNPVTADVSIDSWTFLVNCVVQSLGVISFFGVFLGSVFVFEEVRHRIDHTDKFKGWQAFLWKPVPHFLACIAQCSIFFVPFLILAGIAEWIAAVKCARGHKFDYAVAAKPKVEGQAEEPKDSRT